MVAGPGSGVGMCFRKSGASRVLVMSVVGCLLRLPQSLSGQRSKVLAGGGRIDWLGVRWGLRALTIPRKVSEESWRRQWILSTFLARAGLDLHRPWICRFSLVIFLQ